MAAGLESAAGTPAAEHRFPCLDGYRAVAALTVLLCHVAFNTGRSQHGTGATLLGHTDVGVSIFFVLSGFLLYRPMAVARLSGRRLPSVRNYLVRRALRIVPAYWLSIVLVMLLLAVNVHVRTSAQQWLMHLGFVQIYTNNEHTLGLGQDWSLCTELSFYLFLPLWPWLVQRVRPSHRAVSVRAELIALAALAVGGFVWMGSAHARGGLPTLSGGWLPGHIDWFAAGMALALVSADLKVNPHREPKYRDLLVLADLPAMCWVTAAAIYAFAVTELTGPNVPNPIFTPAQAVTRELIYGLFAVAFLLPGFFGDQRRGLIRAALQSAPLRRLGEASYGIFLFHMGAMYLAHQWTGVVYFTGRFWTILAVTLAVTLPTSFLSLYVIERPVLRRGPRSRPVPVPVPEPAFATG